MCVSKRHFINGDSHIGPHFEQTCRYLLILVARIAIHTYPFLYSLSILKFDPLSFYTPFFVSACVTPGLTPEAVFPSSNSSSESMTERFPELSTEAMNVFNYAYCKSKVENEYQEIVTECSFSFKILFSSYFI